MVGSADYAARTIAGTLGLPSGAYDEVPWTSFEADLGRAGDYLMARTSPENMDVPFGEVLMERALEAFVASRAAQRLPAAQLWFYPEPRPFAVFLSHDVDAIAWSWRRRLLMAARHPRSAFDPRNRYWNFDRVIEIETAIGCRSSFYAVPFGSHRQDPTYRLSEISRVLGDLHARGWEVGVHASYESFNRGDMLAAEKQALEDALGGPVLGVRQHFINFDAPRTWEYQERAGFTYDTTLARRDRAGFRTGFCHPYRPDGRRILEIPLVVMDGQLFWYEHLDEAGAYARTRFLLDAVANAHGVASLNWHQHTMDEFSFPGWWEVYRRCLHDLAGTNAWFVQGSELAEWWNRRSAIRVEERVHDGGTASWTLTDPTGGPVSFRIFRVEGDARNVRVSGLDRYHIEQRVDSTFVSFPDLPTGSPVKISLG